MYIRKARPAVCCCTVKERNKDSEPSLYELSFFIIMTDYSKGDSPSSLNQKRALHIRIYARVTSNIQKRQLFALL